mgnify:CR=1 FL=1
MSTMRIMRAVDATADESGGGPQMTPDDEADERGDEADR